MPSYRLTLWDNNGMTNENLFRTKVDLPNKQKITVTTTAPIPYLERGQNADAGCRVMFTPDGSVASLQVFKADLVACWIPAHMIVSIDKGHREYK